MKWHWAYICNWIDVFNLDWLYVIIYKDWRIKEVDSEWEATSLLDSDTNNINVAMVKETDWYKVVWINNIDITKLP